MTINSKKYQTQTYKGVEYFVPDPLLEYMYNNGMIDMEQIKADWSIGKIQTSDLIRVYAGIGESVDYVIRVLYNKMVEKIDN